MVGKAMEVLWTKPIVTAQMVHFVALLILEILGLLMLNWLTQAAMGVKDWSFFDPSKYQFIEHYKCEEDSVTLINRTPMTQCGNGELTQCYVSRPSEKKVKRKTAQELEQTYFSFSCGTWLQRQ